MKITWTAKSNCSFLDSPRTAKSIRSAILAGRAYVRGELYGEGIVTIFEDGHPVRQDECSVFTGHKWVVRTVF